jgi:hypothetical protein
MPAGDNSPFRRMTEAVFECDGIHHRAKAVTDRVFRQIDVHIPLERGPFEPVENVHGCLIEGQRHLEWKVSIDLEDGVHTPIKNVTRTQVNGASSRGFRTREPRHIGREAEFRSPHGSNGSRGVRGERIGVGRDDRIRGLMIGLSPRGGSD